RGAIPASGTPRLPRSAPGAPAALVAVQGRAARRLRRRDGRGDERPGMKQPFAPILDAAGVVLLDGGLATELERRGADLRDPLWSAKLLLENPRLTRDVHEDYFRAGADVGTSASYQASFLGFVRRALEPKQAAELMRLSVRLVQEARDRAQLDRRLLVAASIGCYGATLADGSEYRGDYDLTVDELVDWHRPRLETLL